MRVHQETVVDIIYTAGIPSPYHKIIIKENSLKIRKKGNYKQKKNKRIHNKTLNEWKMWKRNIKKEEKNTEKKAEKSKNEMLKMLLSKQTFGLGPKQKTYFYCTTISPLSLSLSFFPSRTTFRSLLLPASSLQKSINIVTYFGFENNNNNTIIIQHNKIHQQHTVHITTWSITCIMNYWTELCFKFLSGDLHAKYFLFTILDF